MPKTGHLIAAAAAVTAVALTPATAHAGAFKTLTVSVKLAHASVREPVKLGLAVRVSACADDIQATAVNEQTGAVIRSTVAKQDAKAFSLAFTFTTRNPAGTWVVGDVFGRPCGTAGGQVAFNPAGGYFPAFHVAR
jgi:hypothetical protein